VCVCVYLKWDTCSKCLW